jgi:uncharacterized protein
MDKNVLITGGTGFVGNYLTRLLLNKGYSVSIVTRNSRSSSDGITYYSWNISDQTIDEAAILNANYIIHLAGDNIAQKRWTLKRKAEIINSRTQSIELLYGVLKKHNKNIEAFVSASGIGIYGAVNGEQICTENTTPGIDFIARTCLEWEKSAHLIASLGIRTVTIRTGLVLGKNEGFLKKTTPFFKNGFGAIIASGKQYMPWIHISDLCSIYLEALENANMKGAYNATVNDSTTNALFSKTLAREYGYFIWLPNIPAFILKLILGEMATIVLTGRRVSSDRVKSIGFRFKFKNLRKALLDCVK